MLHPSFEQVASSTRYSQVAAPAGYSLSSEQGEGPPVAGTVLQESGSGNLELGHAVRDKDRRWPDERERSQPSQHCQDCGCGQEPGSNRDGAGEKCGEFQASADLGIKKDGQNVSCACRCFCRLRQIISSVLYGKIRTTKKASKKKEKSTS